MPYTNQVHSSFKTSCTSRCPHITKSFIGGTGLKLTPSLQLIADAMGCILEFVGHISLARSYCLEIYPPVFHNSFKQKVYSLSQPPAKASYNGLSISAYESLITNLTKEEMYEAR